MITRAGLHLPAALFAALGCAALAASCADPVHDKLVNDQGGEIAGIDPSEFHRAGQPCTVCHGTEGPAKTTFSMAGTIFFGPNASVGAEGVNVEMIDSLGSNFIAVTNCVGNFFVTPDEWNPAFPILVQVQEGTGSVTPMRSQISRESSCANCHKDPPNYDTPGHIHTRSSDPAKPFIDPNCPVNPELTNSNVGPPTPVGGAK
jgi:hypothetical protein